MIRILSVVLCSVALCGLARAEDKLSLGVKKGQKVSYSSQRTSDVSFERDGEATKSKSNNSAQFTLSVKDVAEDGKITLEVNYSALKLSNNRGDGFEFDSSKKAEKEDDQAAYLRKVVASTITVEVTPDGKIAGIKGFPTYERPRAEGQEDQAELAHGQMRQDPGEFPPRRCEHHRFPAKQGCLGRNRPPSFPKSISNS